MRDLSILKDKMIKPQSIFFDRHRKKQGAHSSVEWSGSKRKADNHVTSQTRIRKEARR